MRIRDRLFYYKIELVRVIDGDTIVCHLDRGHNKWDKFIHVRLSSINAPELKKETKVKGEESKQFLISLLGTDRILYIKTQKTDSFERYLGRLYVEDTINDIDIDVSQTMVDEGQAIPYMVDIKL